ncbi:MAG TPA: hypothetical protein VFA74_07320 [Terriglobales bacterium]|nr:hypothetical protein [Terriglobales bacterium]
MRNFVLMLLLSVAITGTSLVARADSQQFNGPNGTQTLNANTNYGWSGVSYILTLSGASGSYSGSCAWFTQCKVSAQFTDIVKGITYTETVTGLWNGWGWSNFNLGYSQMQAPEESSLFELAAAALALILVLPFATKLRRSVQA